VFILNLLNLSYLKLIFSNFFELKDFFANSANINDFLPSSKPANGLVFFYKHL